MFHMKMLSLVKKKPREANSYRENQGIKTLKKSVRSKSASNESVSNEDSLYIE